jgi:hypothetical protein
MRSRETPVDSYPIHIFVAVLGFLFLLMLAIVYRGSLLKNDISRRMIYSFLFGTAAVPVIRIQGMLLDIPLPLIVPAELLLLGTCTAVLGASFQRGLFIPAGLWLVLSVLSSILPSLWLEFWMFAYVAGMLSVTYVWRKSKE